MPKINLDDFDQLNMLSTELCVITYLQALVQYDTDNSIVRENELEYAPENAELYLWDRQFEAVNRLKELLESSGGR